MGRKQYVLKLTLEERQELELLVRRGKSAAGKIQRANALLKCDQSEGAPAWTDERIAEAFGVTTRSLENWRKKAVEQGPLAVLERKPRTVAATAFKLDGEQEARLVKLACSTAPPGQARWSLRLLAGKLVELEIVDSISHETVRQTLQKTI